MADRVQIAPRHRRILEALLREHLPGVEVWAYGSRVNGRGHDGSNLDLVLRAPDLQKVPTGQLLDFEDAIRGSNIPFLVEAQDWACLPERFHEEIERGYVVMSDGAAPKAEQRQRGAWYARPQKRPTLPSGTTHPRGLPPVEAISWPLIPARDLFELTYGRALAAPNRRPGNVPVYGTNGRCGTHDAALFGGPGVILGRKGQGPLGVEWSPGPYWVIDTAYTLTPLRPDVDLKFAYYLLKFIGLNHLKDGTSNPTLSRETFGAQALPFPPVLSQRAIAHILGTLDDKIEFNRRMNATLEAMGRALFRSWFVDFDPVRAKMEGCDTKLSKEIANLFPDRLVDSELGEIPEGWTVSHVEDEFEIVMGQSPPGNTYNDTGDGLPFFQGCSDFGFRYPRNRKFCTAPNRLAQPWDTLVSVRAPVGDINMAWERCCIGRGVAALRPRSRAVSYGYCVAQALQAHMREYEHTGTVFGAINRKQLARLPLQQPAPDVICGFEDVVHPWDQTIRLRTAEIATLTALRDGLLSNLVSGELRVRDAERLAGAIA